MSSPSALAVPTWPELVISMTFGEIEEGPFTGLLQITDTSGESTTVRVFKRFGEYRIESLDGELLAARQHRSLFQPESGLTLPPWSAYLEDHIHIDHGHAIERRELFEWQGDDFGFTLPLGPARATEALGRAAWVVELAPPEDESSPALLTIDAATGLQLKMESREHGVLLEWLELEFLDALDDELFSCEELAVYAGSFTEYFDEVPDDTRTRKDKKWLKKSGVGGLRLRYDAPIDVHEFDTATGSFEATVDAEQLFNLDRRPRSEEAWPEHDGYDHEVRWSDGEWDLRLRSDSKIQKRTLKHLRRQTRSL